jgi:hypothetical protein
MMDKRDCEEPTWPDNPNPICPLTWERSLKEIHFT